MGVLANTNASLKKYGKDPVIASLPSFETIKTHFDDLISILHTLPYGKSNEVLREHLVTLLDNQIKYGLSSVVVVEQEKKSSSSPALFAGANNKEEMEDIKKKDRTLRDFYATQLRKISDILHDNPDSLEFGFADLQKQADQMKRATNINEQIESPEQNDNRTKPLTK